MVYVRIYMHNSQTLGNQQMQLTQMQVIMSIKFTWQMKEANTSMTLFVNVI